MLLNTCPMVLYQCQETSRQQQGHLLAISLHCFKLKALCLKRGLLQNLSNDFPTNGPVSNLALIKKL